MGLQDLYQAEIQPKETVLLSSGKAQSPSLPLRGGPVSPNMLEPLETQNHWGLTGPEAPIQMGKRLIQLTH